MDIQSFIFGTLGGLAIFLFGMNYMSEGLKNMGSESFKRILQSLTRNRATALVVGTGITCMIQSSSATSVMVVGFVNAGLLILEQAIAVVLGADIGTTITAWIVSVMGIGKFKIASYALPIIAVGFLIHFTAKKRKTRMVGQALLGFGLLFLGLGTMSDGVRSIKESQMVMDFFASFGRNPFLGVFAGTIVTMIIQSSSASIAIVQVMAFQGIFGLEAALPLMFGADIGTTITAQLAAIGGTKGARGVAMANSLFKIFGASLFMPLLLTGWYESVILKIIPDQIANSTGTNGAVMAQIALAHTAYITLNVLIFSTILWPLLVRGAKRLSRMYQKASEDETERIRYLDPLLLNTPPIALEQCVREFTYMTNLCHKNITASFTGFIELDLKGNEKIERRENDIDDLQANITSYLVELSKLELDEKDSHSIPRLIHCINDAERIGDHAENLIELTELMVSNKLQMSLNAKRDLLNYYNLVDKQFKAVIRALETKSHRAVKEALKLEQQINDDYDKMSQHNVERLEAGDSNVQTGVIFLDMIANLEKIGDHLTNIAERIDLNNHE